MNSIFTHYLSAPCFRHLFVHPNRKQRMDTANAIGGSMASCLLAFIFLMPLQLAANNFTSNDDFNHIEHPAISSEKHDNKPSLGLTCPTITASISGSVSICTGASTNLNVAISGGVSPYTVVYSGGTVTNYIANANIAVSPTSNTTYTLTSVTDANGCTAAVSGSYTVKVGNLPGKFGNALNFDGTNDYVETNADITNLNNASFTIEAWVKTSSSSGVGIVGLMNSNTNWEPGEKNFYVAKDGTPTYVGWGNNYIYSVKTVNDGSWHHVAVVWSYSGSGTSGTGKMYVDGIDQSSASTNHAANYPNVGTIKIGFPNYGSNEAPSFFNGSIDEVRIWNTARTQAQIQNAMNIELLGSESGLVAYYDFNTGTANGNNSSNTTLFNRTSGSYNGTLTNLALTGSTSNWVASNSFNLPAITGNTSFCVGDAYQLSNSTIGGAWSSANTSAVTVSASGLVTGVSGGTSSLTYTLTSALGCVSSVSSNVISDGNTLSLTSANGTNRQSVCVNSPITNITYLATGNASAIFSGLPAGVANNFGSNIATLSGSPSTFGTYTYTVALSTGCFRTGSITVKNLPNNFGNALNFDGTNDYIETSANITALGKASYTMEAWVKTSSTNSMGIVGVLNSNTSWEGGEKLLYVSSNGTPAFVGYGDGYILSTQKINDGTWHHVAVVWTYSGSGSSGTGKMYVDGLDKTSASTSIAANYPNVGTFKIGFPNYSSEAPSFFNGSIDEVRIWSTARTITQIQTYMNTELGGAESGLLAYYDFNVGVASGSNSTVTSMSNIVSSSYTATLTNFSLSGSSSNWVAGSTASIPTITGTNTICINGTSQQANSLLGGSWSSGTTAVASINSTGLVSAAQAGTSAISYQLTSGFGCQASAQTVVTVNPNNTIVVSSGSSTQNVCINIAITNTSYTTTGATGANFSGLPSGVSGSFNANTVSLTGIPTVASTNNYSISLTGGCGAVSSGGTIIVLPNNTVTLSSAGATTAQKICANTALTNISYQTTGATGASFSNLPSGVNGSFNSNVVTISGAPTSSGIYNYTVNLTGGCGTVNSSGTITSYINGTWMGASSANWHDALNWCGQAVPTSSTDVVIPTSSTTFPIASNNVLVNPINNLTIQSGASLTITGVLKIGGGITNNGTLDITSGTLELNGAAAAQTIAGSMFKNNTLGGLTINNAQGVTLQNDSLKLTGTLTPTSGTLTTNNLLVLKSTSAKTANIAAGSGNYISGNVVVERYIPSKASRKYSFIASTLKDTIRNTWQKQFYISGAGTGGTPCGAGTSNGGSNDRYNSNGFDRTITNSPSMFTYNEVQSNGSNWVSITNTTNTILEPGKGYKVNIRGNRNSASVSCSNQLNSSAPNTPEEVVLVNTGKVTTGDVVVSLNNIANSPFTLLGNPYPCQINIAAFQATNTNLNEKFWTYSPSNNSNYTTYSNGIATNYATGYDNTSVKNIASGQAFFVEANANGNVTFKESHKASDNIPNNQYFGSANQKLIRIGLLTTANATLDEVVLRFNSNGAKNYIPAWDAVSINAGNQVLAVLKPKTRLAIATYPENSPLGDTILIGMNSTTVGNFQLDFGDIDALDSGVKVTLLDYFLGTTQILTTYNNRYSFTTTNDTLSKGDKRFKLLFSKKGTVLPIQFVSVEAKQYGSQSINVNWNVGNKEKKSIREYIVERSVDAVHFYAVKVIDVNELTSYSMIDDSLPMAFGHIYYRIKAIGTVGEVYYSAIVSAQLWATTSDSKKPFTIYPNPVKAQLHLMISERGLLPNGLYQLQVLTISGKQLLQKDIVLAQNEMSVGLPKLCPGVYFVSLTNVFTKEKYMQQFVKE